MSDQQLLAILIRLFEAAEAYAKDTWDQLGHGHEGCSTCARVGAQNCSRSTFEHALEDAEAALSLYGPTTPEGR